MTVRERHSYSQPGKVTYVYRYKGDDPAWDDDVEHTDPVELSHEYISYVGGGPLDIRKIYRPEPISFTVTYPPERGGVIDHITYENVVLNGAESWNDPTGSGHLPDPLTQDLSQEVANSLGYKVLADTNPSRPEVSLPTFLGELRELPKTFRDLSQRGFADGKATNLGIQFGVLPFISDVYKLTTLPAAIDKRARELRRLFSGKRNYAGGLVGLRRRLVLGESTVSRQSGVYNAPDYFGDYSFSAVTERKTWGVAHWLPDISTMSPPPVDPLRNINITRVLLGIGENKNLASIGSDLYNLMPWSWLIDWFSNLGDYLDAKANQGIAHSGDVWLCQTATTLRTLTTELRGKGEVRIVSKKRYASTPSLSASVPILSGRQVSILNELGNRYRPR